MIKFKKYSVMLIVIALLTSIFAGCGSKEAVSAETPTAAVSESVLETESPAEMAETPMEASEVPVEETSAAEPAEEAQTAVEVSYPLTEEPVTFTYLQMWDSRSAGTVLSSGSDLNYFKKASELTNVFLEFTDVAREAYADNVSIILASGDYPDMISNPMETNTSINTALEEGIILDLAEMAETLAPNFQSVTPDFYFLDTFMLLLPDAKGCVPRYVRCYFIIF